MATTGIMVQLHYCGAQVQSWAINGENKGCKDDPCDEQKEKDDHCCKDKVIKAKIASEQVSSHQFKLIFSEKTALCPLPLYYSIPHTALAEVLKTIRHQANAPPGTWQQIPLYKLHSSYTYYG